MMIMATGNVEMDADILAAIDSTEGILTAFAIASKLSEKYGKTSTFVRIKENKKLQEALNKKAIEFIEESSNVDFAFSLNKVKNLRGEVKKKAHERAERMILDAINSPETVPSPVQLSVESGGPCHFNYKFIWEFIRNSKVLQKAQNEKFEKLITETGHDDFVVLVTTNKFTRVSPELKALVEERIEREILEEIEAFDGIPSHNQLAKKRGGGLSYLKHVISRRIRNSPKLQEALEKKRKEHDKTAEILDAINSFHGMPNPFNLSKKGGGPLPYKNFRIADIINASLVLQNAIHEKSVLFIRECSPEEFWMVFSVAKSLTEDLREEMDERAHALLLEAIDAYEGIPTYSGICSAKLVGCDNQAVIRLTEKFGDIGKKMMEKGEEYIKTCTDEEFIKSRYSWGNLTEPLKVAANERTDGMIMDAICSFDGLLTPAGIGRLSRKDWFSSRLIGRRMKANPAILETLRKRGIWYVRNCDKALFDDGVTSTKWNNVDHEIKKAINERVDGYISEAIGRCPAITSLGSLSFSGYGTAVLTTRLKENPELRRRFLLKKGLTEDQVNALEAERDYPSQSFKQSIRKRLPNTRVFREALGIVRQFAEELGGRVLEISFYPEPLRRAADMLGISLNSDYVRAHDLRDPDFGITERFDTVVLTQCGHRISNESLVRAFNQVNMILDEGGVMLLSVPQEYTRTLVFERQVQDFGYEIRNEGTMYTKTLSIDELHCLGVADAKRVKQKIEQATNMFSLVKTRPATGAVLDSFVREKEKGKGEFRPSMGEINTPAELLEDLSSAYQKRLVDLGEGFVLSILDDTSYQERDLVGYDMNPKVPRTMELSSVHNHAIDITELSQLARRMTKSSFREKVLVRPGRETKIPAKLIRKAMAA